MTRIPATIAGLLLLAGLLAASPSYAVNTKSLLIHAADTIQSMRSDPNFGPSEQLLRRAVAVMVVPKLWKGGFVFGAEGGNGVLLARTRNGWSPPAFYTIGSASFGLQVGLERAQFVMFIMSDRALRAVESDKFKLGAGAGLSIATIGANGQLATTGALNGDIVIWSAAEGAYGGLTLEGSILAPDTITNAQFYDRRRISVPQILAGYVRNPEARPLQNALYRQEVPRRQERPETR